MTDRSFTATVRLYETDSHLMTFSATVLSCQSTSNGYDVVLDRTAFFPMGGGQPCDSGTLEGCSVSDVRLENGTIFHTLPSPLPCGTKVLGKIDEKPRLRRMANHSGEHILSAVMAKRHGLNNVGFHMGSKDVTCDFDGVIGDEALRAVEDEVNRIIRENHPITAHYPDRATLASLSYRSKLDLTGPVRIVTIGENGSIDHCACCAPHVTHTGEIGLLRLVATEHYKGGLRLHILCGADALERCREDALGIAALSALLSTKPEGNAISTAVLQLCQENKAQKEVISHLNDTLNRGICRDITPSNRPLFLFDHRDDTVALRKLATLAKEAAQNTVAVFGGHDETGYRFVLCADKGLKALYAAMCQKLPCRGGGSDTLICGSVMASRAVIEGICQTIFSL